MVYSLNAMSLVQERMLFDTLLAQALQPDGHFNPDGLQQTYDALDNIAARIQEYLVAGYVLMGKRQIATGAVRGCKRGSRDTFSCTARSIIGTPVNVLTGEKMSVTGLQAGFAVRGVPVAVCLCSLLMHAHGQAI